ncbi:type II toxin-antitoxin system VapC family toxin [candidate division KSB1 bacterium]
MAYLFDTNIFLEIFLDQENKDKAKKIISENLEELYVSDFTIHSIGVILINQKKHEIFQDFLNDLTPYLSVLSIPKLNYSELIEISKDYNLDFDDSYQALIAKENNLTVVTMDNDFKKIKSFIEVKFI